jgi:hypothetical protein
MAGQLLDVQNDYDIPVVVLGGGGDVATVACIRALARRAATALPVHFIANPQFPLVRHRQADACPGQEYEVLD